MTNTSVTMYTANVVALHVVEAELINMSTWENPALCRTANYSHVCAAFLPQIRKKY